MYQIINYQTEANFSYNAKITNADLHSHSIKDLPVEVDWLLWLIWTRWLVDCSKHINSKILLTHGIQEWFHVIQILTNEGPQIISNDSIFNVFGIPLITYLDLYDKQNNNSIKRQRNNC